MLTKLCMLGEIFLPMCAGLLIALVRPSSHKLRNGFVMAVLAVEVALTGILSASDPVEMILFRMSDNLQVAVRMDAVSRLFMLIASIGFFLAGLYACRYMDKEEEGAFSENFFFTFYLLSLGALMGMDLSSNLISMYFFFEMITLLSMPMVLHERTKESIAAALKYLFYSIAGAFMALGCIFVLAHYETSVNFVTGGNLDMALVSGHETLIRIVMFIGVMGFGAKAGMYPLHGWLPSAHPVAPAPASAVLSGIIAKAGVLAIIRLIYFSCGTDILLGTWVPLAWQILSLCTVFMGSMMAYREKVFKKRLAYSSVSQISYALFGIFLMNPIGLTGGLMQIMFHACVKICLFMTAGSMIYNKGFHHVEELKGVGKTMPKTMGAFTLASLSLIGIPPFAGFVCKWYLAEGSLNSGVSALSWIGPIVLLLSALLTAGYLLPITVSAFFPGKDWGKGTAACEVSLFSQLEAEGGWKMVLPIMILAVLALLLGFGSGLIKPFFDTIVSSML